LSFVSLQVCENLGNVSNKNKNTDKRSNRTYKKIDFLLSTKTKLIPIEVKSSGLGRHKSIIEFQKKYSKYIAKEILLSQKDLGNEEMLKLYPIYMLPFILEEL